MGKKPAATEAGSALSRLREARVSASAVHQEMAERKAVLSWQSNYQSRVVTAFSLRRDHLLTAAEAQPLDSRQAAELASTAERLRRGVQHTRDSLTEPLNSAAAHVKKAADLLTRIDTAIGRLDVAIKTLELLKAEQVSRDELAELERSSMARLQQMGQSTPQSAPRAALGNAAPVGIDAQMREVTRLAYEAEALAELQSESI